MKKSILTVLLSTLIAKFCWAQSEGDIQFIGYNSDGNDDFAIVTLTELDGSSSSIDIIFTDNEWDGTAFTSGEDEITWTISSTISAGTVVTFSSVDTGTPSVSVGSLTGSDMNLTNSNEAIFAITGSQASPTAFLAALTNDDFVAAGATLTGTSLTLGTHAIELDGTDADTDIAEYTGTKTGTAANLRSAINDASNWTTQDATGDQSNDAVEPDVPFDATAFTVLTTVTWDGSESTDWSDPENWDTGAVPTAANNVVIPNLTNDPVVNGDEIAYDLTIQTSATVTVSSGASLAIFGSASGAGDAVVSRNTTGSLGYSIIGSPITDATIAGLSADFIYDYDGSDFIVPTGNMTPGKGYFAAFNTASPTISFTGTPNSGDVTYGLSTSGDAFNVVSNPYCAAIDQGDFVTENAGVMDGNIWFWDDGGANVSSDRGGDYIVVNNLGATSTNDLSDGVAGNKGTSVYNGNIGSMQGFLVKASSASDLTFTPDMQSTTTGDNADAAYYRTGNGNFGNEYQTIRLALTGNNLYNDLIIGLDETATWGDDYAMDAIKHSGNQLISFYSMINDKKYSIQGIPAASEEIMIVPLGMDIAEAGNYQLKISEINNFPEDIVITLIDEEERAFYNLREINKISFASSVVNGLDRFKVSFVKSSVTDQTDQSTVTSIDEDLHSSLKVMGNLSALKVNYNSNEIESLALYTLNGKIVFNERVRFVNNEVTIFPRIVENQIYILRVGNEAIKFVVK